MKLKKINPTSFDLSYLILQISRRATANDKFTFLTSIAVGFVTHLYSWNNRLINEDGMIIIRDRAVLVSGRWANNMLVNLSFGFHISLVNGLFQLLFLSALVVVVTKSFEVQNKLDIALISGLIVSFPAIAHTNIFVFEGGGYFLAAFLSGLAFYVTKKYKWGFLAGSVFLMLTLAIYQSKVSVALMLCLLWGIDFTLGDDFTYASFWEKVSKFVALVMLGFLLFFITSHPSVLGVEHARAVAFHDLTHIISQARVSYRDFLEFFTTSRYLTDGSERFIQLHLLLAVFTVAILIYTMVKKSILQQPLRILLVVAMFGLMPFAANLARFFATAMTTTTVLMTYSFVFVPVLCVILAKQRSTSSYLAIVRSVQQICVFVLVVLFVIHSNLIYLRFDMYHQRTVLLYNRILTRIEPLLSESENNTVAFIGNLSHNAHYPFHDNLRNERATLYPEIAGFFGQFIGLHRNYQSFIINHYHHQQGILLNHVALSELDDLRERAVHLGLPVWPHTDSVTLLDGVIAVNLGSSLVVRIEELEEEYHKFVAVSNVGYDPLYPPAYTWYVYRDGIRIETIWMVRGKSELVRSFDTPGTYRVRVFMHNPEGGFLANIALSDSILLE